MNILLLMIPVTLLLVIGFVVAFLWATRDGQFDDLETPAHRILADEVNLNLKENKRDKQRKDSNYEPSING
ncbi:MAG: cbb3-type cytochrome oxidase assembly protein CcoS [Pseudobdellovibrionaceae bacterium]|nr:cbb3-type cytochrome oxidase assembly protein CcoS [Bdellovibrionales bacterium]USN48320.1 MAG: cbb3-type cytochrome oxidase assembly protein CcoS [Pseudobdellovibrionaceae bacterium]